MRAPSRRTAFVWLTLALTILSTGCATARNPRDPLEPLNRTVYQFNEAVDKAVLKPVAKGYRAVVPVPVRSGVTSVFGNFRDVTSAINNLLQLKVPRAASDVGRVAVNSTVGILGFFDVASRLGLPKHDEDFGQTLGYWGLPTGPYLVLPFFGPNDIRDTVGLAVDRTYTDLVREIEDVGVRNRTYLGRAIQARSDLLDAKAAVEAAALDGYEFSRDFYLERRRALVHDGRPPPENP